MRLQEGDLYTPVTIEGYGIYHAMTKRLETLRLTLLNLADSEIESNKKTSTAISSVAHDMKTPLAIIAGYAECMSDGMNDKDYPALILQKTNQMNEMVIELVENSHKELSKQASHKNLHDSRVLFGRIIEKIKPLGEKKNIKIKVSRIPSERIRVNEQQIERVVQNLVSNAIKYSPQNTTIKVVFERWGRDLIIKVKDKGIGISKDALPLIFDQFYTEDKSRSNADNQGLGLYITKEIVKDHGGEIYAKSKKNKGSSFIVKLPIEPHVDEKVTLTARFERKPKIQKFFIVLLFGWILIAAYRICRFFETRCVSTLFAGVLLIALFPLMYVVDLASIIVYNKITFLAD